MLQSEHSSPYDKAHVSTTVEHARRTGALAVASAVSHMQELEAALIMQAEVAGVTTAKVAAAMARAASMSPRVGVGPLSPPSSPEIDARRRLASISPSSAAPVGSGGAATGTKRVPLNAKLHDEDEDEGEGSNMARLDRWAGPDRNRDWERADSTLLDEAASRAL